MIYRDRYGFVLFFVNLGVIWIRRRYQNLRCMPRG